MLFHKAFIYPNLVVLPLPKCACTSIQKALQSGQSYSIRSTGHLQPDGKKVFTLTRSPYDRIVSFYLNKIKRGDSIEKNLTHEDLGFYVGMPFHEMVEAIHGIPDQEANRHFKQQTALCSPHGTMLATHIWSWDNIDGFWSAVQKEIDVPNLEHRRRTASRQHYRKYYTEYTRRLVEERYSDDLELLRYQF